MYIINKITSNHVVDFAAEELKKYLRMMMPRCGEIEIAYAPEAKDGFRLGLMEDFGLDTSESDNTALDDILHIDTDKDGGIIAGSNPRSVLLAVYRYLTINGCRWLFPGIDGEFIPIKDIEPTKFHKMADCRYRGQCNEGAEFQPQMMAAIDFTPKIGMNIFMIEFDNPTAYYNSYYKHIENAENRMPEPITPETILQWKRQCEAEISKRGLQFHDMGHGWTGEAFKIKSDGCWYTTTDDQVPEEYRDFLALYQGKRALYRGMPLNTNFCMSNPKARDVVAKAITDYADKARNVDYLHVWLSDSYNNMCECEECRKKLPSDWYVMLMNRVDEMMTERGLKTRVVFICYYDTVWAPETEKLNNPDRFALLLAAITRDYTESVNPNIDESKIQLTEYQLNTNVMPKSVNNYIIHAKQWRERCKVPNFIYEYHFWWPQYRDFGMFGMAENLHNDIKGYKANGCSGIVEDGSQRSYFPNGFNFTVYGSTLFDCSVNFEDIKEDYFKHAYGDDYKTVIEMMNKLGEAVDFKYFTGSRPHGSSFIAPERVEGIKSVAKIIEEYTPFVKEHMNMPYRAQTVAYRMLNRYLEWCTGVSEALALKAEGKEEEALELHKQFLIDFGKYELEMEYCYDHYAMANSLHRIFKNFTALYNTNT
jgi:hypothetical protein